MRSLCFMVQNKPGLAIALMPFYGPDIYWDGIALIAFYGPDISWSGYIDWTGYCVNWVLWHQSRLVWELPIAIYTTRAVAAAIVVVVDLAIDHGSDMAG